MINAAGINFNKKITVKSEETPKQEKKQETVSPEIKKSLITSEYAMAAFGIHKASASPGKTKTADTKQYVNNLSFSEKMSPEDKRYLNKILGKNNEDTDYAKKMIGLIEEEKVNPYALTHLCQQSQMSDLVKSDMDIYFDKVVGQNMSVEDAFIPVHDSQKTGQKATAVGDVFRVKGQDKIYAKTGDDYSRQLELDAPTYLKLFPPVERYASTQGEAGDCYLLSAINGFMENPYSRAVIYDCFSQNKNGVTVKTYTSKAKINSPDCKLPKDADETKYAAGAPGIQLIEHLYGKNVEKRKLSEYSKIMSREISRFTKQLENYQNSNDASTEAKQQKISKKLEGYKSALQTVKEDAKSQNNKIAFILDDNDDFIMGKNGPMFEECNKLHSGYTHPSDYYRGSNGGLLERPLEFFGFLPEIYEPDMDEEELDDALFNEDVNAYIITASTSSSREEDGVEKPIDEDYSVYSLHVYKISPFDDADGNRMFKVTNPWNQSQQVVMDDSQLKEYFTSFSVTEAK